MAMARCVRACRPAGRQPRRAERAPTLRSVCPRQKRVRRAPRARATSSAPAVWTPCPVLRRERLPRAGALNLLRPSQRPCEKKELRARSVTKTNRPDTLLPRPARAACRAPSTPLPSPHNAASAPAPRCRTASPTARTWSSRSGGAQSSAPAARPLTAASTACASAAARATQSSRPPSASSRASTCRKSNQGAGAPGRGRRGACCAWGQT